MFIYFSKISLFTMVEYTIKRDYSSRRELSRRFFLGGSIATAALIAASPLEVLAHEERTSITFASGSWSKKDIDGHETMAQPSAYYDGISMGVALRQKCGHDSFWGLWEPKLVLTTYRGMKIAEQVRVFEERTLCACWYAGKRKVRESEQKYVNEIEQKIGKSEREIISYTIPSNFENMLTRLSRKGIDIAWWEIEDEVKDGVLTATPKIQAFLDGFHREMDSRPSYDYGW